MQFLVLVAGNNEPSNSDVLADAFMQGIAAIGNATVVKRRLRDMSLDHFTLRHYEPGFPEEKDFTELRALIEQADGFVIATPIWNFGVPAHLKNVIDRMGSFGLDSDTRSKGTLGGKPFYLIFTGGAPTAAWLGLMRFTTSFVREGLRYFNATPFGTHFEPKCMRGRGKFGLVVGSRPESLAAMRTKGENFARSVNTFCETGKLPFKQRMYEKFFALGKKILARL